MFYGFRTVSRFLYRAQCYSRVPPKSSLSLCNVFSSRSFNSTRFNQAVKQRLFRFRSYSASLYSPKYSMASFSLKPNHAAIITISGALGGVLGYFILPRFVFPDRVIICSVPKPDDLVEHPYEAENYLWKMSFKLKRFIYLFLLFFPCISCGVVQYITGDEYWRKCFLSLLTSTIECAGCSFQKYAQWMSMRPDMFSADTIDALSKLHMRDGAPQHDMKHTRKMIQESFGLEIEDIFEFFDETPIASGTVAQVHRARLRHEYALPCQKDRLRIAQSNGSSGEIDFKSAASSLDVAVKIRHPSVIAETFVDVPLLFDMMKAIPFFTVPFSQEDFTIMLQRQFDFKWEAYNLVCFAKNFRSEIEAGEVYFPEVSPELLSSTVLVESWCDARSVANIFEVVTEGWSRVEQAVSKAVDETIETMKKSGKAVDETIETMKKSLAVDETIETMKKSLDPLEAPFEAVGEAADIASDGIKEASEGIKTAFKTVQDMTSSKLKAKQQQLARIIFDVNIKMMIRDNLVHGDLHAGNLLFNENPDNMTLTVIDAGVTTSLSDEMRAPFMGFLYAMCTGDAAGMANRLVQFSEKIEGTEDPIDVLALEKDIKEIASHWVGPSGTCAPDGGPISVGDLMGELLFNLHKHNVRLKGDVASSLVTISISEGLIRQLDPEFDMVQNALPYFVMFQKEIRRLNAEDTELFTATNDAVQRVNAEKLKNTNK